MRSQCFSLANSCSIGFWSGGYFGQAVSVVVGEAHQSRHEVPFPVI